MNVSRYFIILTICQQFENNLAVFDELLSQHERVRMSPQHISGSEDPSSHISISSRSSGHLLNPHATIRNEYQYQPSIRKYKDDNRRLGISTTTPTRLEKIVKKGDKGRITFDLGTQSIIQKLGPIHTRRKKETKDEKDQHVTTTDATMRVSIDATATARLVPLLFVGSSYFFNAFLGTLRLLAPLIVARRSLTFLGELLSDYLAGRYFRETYTRLEKAYLNYYEAPAMFRAASRFLSQLFVYNILGNIMGWLVGISHPPCHGEGRGLALLCALLWVGAVIGSGHAFSTAVAIWGGPIRLQAAHYPKRTSVVKVFIRPWHILRWMANPEEWIKMISAPDMKPFDVNPIIYPATWVPLQILQMFAVAQAASTEPGDYIWCSSNVDQVPRLMKQFFIQFALCGEWIRVFIGERRAGLSIGLGVVYLIAMIVFMTTTASMNRMSAFLMIPSLLAVIISLYMNVVIYWNRSNRQKRRLF